MGDSFFQRDKKFSTTNKRRWQLRRVCLPENAISSVGHLFKMDISRFIDMGLSNKFLNRDKGKKEILALMNYYIGTSNIHYVDSEVEEKDEKDDDNNENWDASSISQIFDKLN